MKGQQIKEGERKKLERGCESGDRYGTTISKSAILPLAG